MQANDLIKDIKKWKDDTLPVRIKTSDGSMDINSVRMSTDGTEIWIVPNACFEEDIYDADDDLY